MIHALKANKKEGQKALLMIRKETPKGMGSDQDH